MRKTLSLIAIYMLLTMGAIAQRPINGLAHRILGNKDTHFIFVCQPDTIDFFQIEAAYEHHILIIGNNDNSLAMGLNYYLKHIAGVHVS